MTTIMHSFPSWFTRKEPERRVAALAAELFVPLVSRRNGRKSAEGVQWAWGGGRREKGATALVQCGRLHALSSPPSAAGLISPTLYAVRLSASQETAAHLNEIRILPSSAKKKYYFYRAPSLDPCAEFQLNKVNLLCSIVCGSV